MCKEEGSREMKQQETQNNYNNLKLLHHSPISLLMQGEGRPREKTLLLFIHMMIILIYKGVRVEQDMENENTN